MAFWLTGNLVNLYGGKSKLCPKPLYKVFKALSHCNLQSVNDS